jgi:hypothetical protein
LASASGMVGPSMRSRTSSPPLSPVTSGRPFHQMAMTMKITTIDTSGQ